MLSPQKDIAAQPCVQYQFVTIDSFSLAKFNEPIYFCMFIFLS